MSRAKHDAPPAKLDDCTGYDIVAAILVGGEELHPDWHKAFAEWALRRAEEARVPAVFAHYAYGWFVHRVSRGPGRDSALAIQHGGSINRFGAMTFRVPEDGIAIIYLDNTGQHPPLERDILRILYGEEPDPPVASIARTIYPVILKDGMAPAVSRYRALKSGQPHQYDFGEQELNLLGYHLLATSRVSEATAIFRLNTECYPESGNAFDSLGEAELAAGDTAAPFTITAPAYRRRERRAGPVLPMAPG